MKTFTRVLSIAAIVCCAAGFAYSQSAGDFRSVATGNWVNTSTWETFDGADWIAASTAPDSNTVGTITIQSGHTVTITSSDTVRVKGSAVVVDGYLTDGGRITTMTGATWTFNSGATYEMAHPSASGAGIPTATWNTGSTCLITGVTSATTGINANQNFYNFTWNCANQIASVNLGWNTITIGGDLNILSTGPTLAIYLRLTNNTLGLSQSTPSVITVNGNVNVSGRSFFTTSGSGAPNHYIQFLINGNFSYTSSDTSSVQLGNGSGAQATWRVKGDVTTTPTAGGTFTTNSGAGVPDSLIFCGSGVQTFENNIASLSNIKISVTSGATLSMQGTSTIGTASSTLVTLFAGSTFACGSTSGLEGNLTGTGSKTIDPAANFIYSASGAQVTGTLLPSTIHNLSIFTPAGLTLTNGVTVTGSCTIAGGASIVESAGKYVLGYASTIQSVGTGASTLGGLGVSVNAGGGDDLGAMTVARTTGSAGVVTVSSVSGIARKWTVVSSNPPTNGRDITLTWDSGDDNGKTLTSGDLWKSTDAGSTWSEVAMGDYSSRSVTLSGATSFEQYTVTDLASPLPVELTRFVATASAGNSAVLEWSTATESNSANFVIERRLVSVQPSAGAWKAIGSVAAAGNSSAPRQYSYTDAGLSAGRYAYQVKEISKDGIATAHASVEVEVGLAPRELSLGNYPNPFNPMTTIEFALPADGFAKVSVFNLLGQEVARVFEGNAKAGQFYRLSLDGSRLTSGIYLYAIESGGQRLLRRAILLK